MRQCSDRPCDVHNLPQWLLLPERDMRGSARSSIDEFYLCSNESFDQLNSYICSLDNWGNWTVFHQLEFWRRIYWDWSHGDSHIQIGAVVHGNGERDGLIRTSEDGREILWGHGPIRNDQRGLWRRLRWRLNHRVRRGMLSMRSSS